MLGKKRKGIKHPGNEAFANLMGLRKDYFDALTGLLNEKIQNEGNYAEVEELKIRIKSAYNSIDQYVCNAAFANDLSTRNESLAELNLQLKKMGF